MKFISEHSIYQVKSKDPYAGIIAVNLRTGSTVILTQDYVDHACETEEHASKHKVTLTELRDLLSNIPVGTLFTAVFKTKPKQLSEKERVAQVWEKEKIFWNLLEDNHIDAAEEFFKDALNNPIKKEHEGEIRTMVACKTGKVNHGGLFQVIDVEQSTPGNLEYRYINPQTISELTTQGVKYHL